MVEHMTFNHGVGSSSLPRHTTRGMYLLMILSPIKDTDFRTPKEPVIEDADTVNSMVQVHTE